MSNIVWSKMQCHFCDMAKRLLEQKEPQVACQMKK